MVPAHRVEGLLIAAVEGDAEASLIDREVGDIHDVAVGQPSDLPRAAEPIQLLLKQAAVRHAREYLIALTTPHSPSKHWREYTTFNPNGTTKLIKLIRMNFNKPTPNATEHVQHSNDSTTLNEDWPCRKKKTKTKHFRPDWFPMRTTHQKGGINARTRTRHNKISSNSHSQRTSDPIEMSTHCFFFYFASAPTSQRNFASETPLPAARTIQCFQPLRVSYRPHRCHHP